MAWALAWNWDQPLAWVLAEGTVHCSACNLGLVLESGTDVATGMAWAWSKERARALALGLAWAMARVATSARALGPGSARALGPVWER